MGRRIIALVLASLGLGAAAAFAHSVVATTAYATHRLRPAGPTAFSVTCGRRDVATSAGVVRPAPGSRLLEARPIGKRTFIFRFASTGRSARVTVGLACRRSSAGGPALRETRVARRVAVPAGSLRPAALSCPAQTTPAGFGVDLGRGGAGVLLRRAVATVRGFEFTVSNGSTAPRRVVVSGVCLTSVAAAGSRLEPLRVRFISFSDPVGTGLRHVVHACPSGSLSLAAGYSLDRPSLRVDGAAAVGAAGSWWVENERAAGDRVVLQLLCAQLGS